MIYILYQLLIFSVGISLMMIFFKKKFEKIHLVVSVVFIIISSIIIQLIDYDSQTACKEVWSGEIVSVDHTEEWDEYIPPYDEVKTETYVDSKGKTHTKTYTVHHDGYLEHHSAKNYIKTSDEGTFSVTSGINKETGEKCDFNDTFPNNNNDLEKFYPIGEPTASVHEYTNKVQASESIYNPNKINIKDYPDLENYKYPINQYNKCKINRAINLDDDVRDYLDKINSNLNNTDNPNNTDEKKSYKQVNIILVNMEDKSKDYGYALQSYWKGGNKNDLVITFSRNDDGTFNWIYPFTWCENSALIYNITQYCMDDANIKDKDYIEILDYISDQVEENYTRKEMKDFDYLVIEVRLVSKIIMIILVIMVLVILYECYSI